MTTEAASSMQGRVCVVTGATSGLGRETSRQLAMRGASLVLVGRRPERLQAVAGELARLPGAGPVETVCASDLASLTDVRGAGMQLVDRFPQIHVLVNNAGATFSRRQVTPDGFERTWALNVLSPFLLTTLLAPALARGGDARVVNVSSAAHRGQRMHWEDPASESYSALATYGRSKLALILLTHEFARRLAGQRTSVNALHPGFVRTGFGQNNPGAFGLAFHLLTAAFGISVQRGARTMVHLASDPLAPGSTGLYFVRSQPRRSSRASYDPSAEARLFARCAEETGTAGALPPA